MKIIESKPNINWRNIKSNVEIQNVIKEFDELLNNESFNGLKKINSRLNLKNFRKLKVSKKEFEECSNYLSDDEKFSLYEAIKNISFVCKSQLNSSSKSIEPINGLSIWDK